MALMAELGIKISGEWHNVTISVNDETNEWGKNINVWKSQTKEQREAKADREYCGNGKVFWVSEGGRCVTAERKEEAVADTKDDLPF